MGIAAKSAQEKLHLLMHHGVVQHAVNELLFLRRVGQFALQQQIAGLEKIAIGGELLDRITAVQQFALVAINKRDRGIARCCRQKAGVVGEHAGLRVQLADVDHIRAMGAAIDRQNNGLAVTVGKGCLAFFIHDHALLIPGK